jgi:protein involved in polysaccharide export with SLBB domain
MTNASNRTAALLGAAASLLTACGHPASYRSDVAVTHRPAWVEALGEQVQTVPVPASDVPAAPRTPTAWRPGERLPRGVPVDLTRPVRQPSQEVFPAGRATPARMESSEDAATLQGSVVVNVSTSRGAEPVEPAVETQPPSALERLYGGQYQREADRALVQFGYDFFDGPAQVDLGPLVEGMDASIGGLRLRVPRKLAHLLDVVEGDALGRVPDDYEVGPGDELRISVTGSFELHHAARIDREGRITVPGVGVVGVTGRTLADTERELRATLGRTRKDFELTVSLARLRDVRVHVVGHVARPGAVDVPAHGTVLTALLAAGGPTKDGSLRRISVRREGQADRAVDLYELLIRGRAPDRTILRAGDVLHVPPVGATIGVAGYAQRPAIYELLGEATLGEVIELAGGLTPFTFTPRVRVETTVAGRGRVTADVTLDESGLAAPVGDGALILIGAVDDRLQPLVRIEGEVVRPGAFEFQPGLRVSDLVARADGLTVDAFLDQAFVSRVVGDPGALDVVPGRVRSAGTRRVLVVDLARALRGDADHDVELRPLDLVTVQAVERAAVRPTVSVIGAVRAPGTFELTAGLRVSDLVALAGNVLPHVFYDEAELVRRVLDERSQRLDVVRHRFDLRRALEGGDDPVLVAGDRLVIRALRKDEVTVRVVGEVRFPGTYVFPAGSRITDMLAAAGGLTAAADLRAARFTRESVRRLEAERFRDLEERTRRAYEATAERMVQVGRPREGLAAKLALFQTQDLLERMGEHEVSGRIVIPFGRADFPSSRCDLALENGDRLLVPRRQETVAVLGHVFRPTSFVAEDGLRVLDVIRRAGGLDEYADDERVYVIRADGNIESFAQEDDALQLESSVHAGDVVLVPRAPLERSLGDQAADALGLIRQAAEIALLLSHLGDGTGDLDITAVSQPGVRGTPSGYDEAILKPRR